MITFVIGYDATNSSYSRSEGFTQNSFFLLLTCPPNAITKTLHPTVPASVRWVGALKSPLRCLYVWQEGNLFWSVSVQGSRVWNVFCKGVKHISRWWLFAEGVQVGGGPRGTLNQGLLILHRETQLFVVERLLWLYRDTKCRILIHSLTQVSTFLENPVSLYNVGFDSMYALDWQMSLWRTCKCLLISFKTASY